MARPSRTGSKKSEAKARDARPAEGGKTAKNKRRVAPAATRLKRHSVSDPNNDLKEAREQQAATAEILRVIASSPSDVQPVLDAILGRALQLCEAAFAFLTNCNGERFEFVAQRGVPTKLAQHFRQGMEQPQPGDAHWLLLAGEDLIHNLDQKDEDAYRAGNPLRRAGGDLGGARSGWVVALRKNGSLRGAITIYRKEVKPFSQPQIALLRHFADQTVIAIENARLFDAVQARTEELRQSLEYQTATSEVLSIISRSPTDVQPVFEAIAASALRLCGAKWSVVTRFDGVQLHLAALHNLSDPAGVDAIRKIFPRPLSRGGPTDRAILTGTVINLPDVLKDPEYIYQSISNSAGYRSH